MQTIELESDQDTHRFRRTKIGACPSASSGVCLEASSYPRCRKPISAMIAATNAIAPLMAAAT